jgi:hypothetical protein
LRAGRGGGVRPENNEIGRKQALLLNGPAMYNDLDVIDDRSFGGKQRWE